MAVQNQRIALLRGQRCGFVQGERNIFAIDIRCKVYIVGDAVGNGRWRAAIGFNGGAWRGVGALVIAIEYPVAVVVIFLHITTALTVDGCTGSGIGADVVGVIDAIVIVVQL